MSRFIVHIEGDLTHQQVCALAVAVNQQIGVMAEMDHGPNMRYRWEYQQNGPVPTTRDKVREAMGFKDRIIQKCGAD